MVDGIESSLQSLLHHHDILDDLLRQFQQDRLGTVPQVVRHLLIAHPLLLAHRGISDLQQERGEGLMLELVTFVQITEYMHDAGHSQEVVKS